MTLMTDDKPFARIFLAVLRLGLCAFPAEDLGSILDRGTWSHSLAEKKPLPTQAASESLLSTNLETDLGSPLVAQW